MTKVFIDALATAIDNAPNEKIAQQLQMLLDRLQATGGKIPSLPGIDPNQK